MSRHPLLAMRLSRLSTKERMAISTKARKTIACGCGAQPGERCRSGRGQARKVHFLRLVRLDRATPAGVA